MAKGDIPAKNSSEWIKNEKIINKTPLLRNARDSAEGLGTSSDISTQVPTQKYKTGYDAIDWSKK